MSTQVKFDDDIPPPTPTKKALQAALHLDQMKPGQSFFRAGDLKEVDKIKAAVSEFGKAQEPAWTFTTERRTEEVMDPKLKKAATHDGVRVWRLT